MLIFYMLFCVGILAQAADAEVPLAPLVMAQKHYAAAEYRAAIHILQDLLETQPESAEVHYWLGKAYGRSAEQANAFRAYGLARKSLRAFERAVALDPNYHDAWQALFDFYSQAPGIVGGSKKKAQYAAVRLTELDSAESFSN